uniref:Uncharacterized protein n=1 Tax=Timema monikensis TaxID=170555 RepID=A0A7R9HPL9_9NEOP|nr:unnamed protein product [Timema monikensis]
MVRDTIRNEEGSFSFVVALATRYEIPGPANASDNPNLINVARPYQQKNQKFKKKFQSSQGPKPQLSSRPNHQPSQSALCEGCGGPHVRVKNSSLHQGGVRQIQEDIPSVFVQASKACDLYVINSSQAPARSSVQLEVNGVPFIMEVDTAARAILIGNPVYLAHFKHIPLVQGDVVGLLGNKYLSVFKEVPTDIKGVEINVVLKEGAGPVFYGPRVIPIPLRNDAKKAYEEMESSDDLVWVRSFTHRKLKAVPGEIQHRVSTVSYIVIVGGCSKQTSTSHLRLRDHKAVPVELSWETPPIVADHSLPASPAPEPSKDFTPEAFRQAPSVMAPAHTPVRSAAASPRVSAPQAASSNSSPGAAPVTTRSGRQRKRPTFVWRETGKPFRKNHPSSPERDSYFDLPILGCQAQYKSSALSNYATEAGPLAYCLGRYQLSMAGQIPRPLSPHHQKPLRAGPSHSNRHYKHHKIPSLGTSYLTMPEKLFKVIIIGDPTVGKTSFVQRYVQNSFRKDYKGTVGVDFALKILKWSENQTIKLQLWDIAGQERFTWMTRVYYKDSHGCVIMFDLTNKNSFVNTLKWKRDVDSKCSLPDGSPIPCMLLANKVVHVLKLGGISYCN